MSNFTVDVDEYCALCDKFDPVANNSTLWADNNIVMVEHLITCSNRSICKSLEHHLREVLSQDK